MYEQIGSHTDTEQQPLEIRDRELLIRAFGQERDAPQDNDLVMKAFFAAAREDMLCGGPLAGVMHEAMLMRNITLSEDEAEASGKRYMKPLAMVNLCFRAYQDIKLQIDDSYPNDVHKKQDVWHETFSELAAEDHEYHDLLLANLIMRTIQSNVPDRYKAHRLILTSELSGDDRNISMLDVGCSAMLGLRKLAIGHPFTPVESVKKYRGRVNNLGMTALLNEELQAPFFLDEYVGLDPEPIKIPRTNEVDPMKLNWVRSCSFRPNELSDEAKIAEWNMLSDLEIEGEHFLQGYFTPEKMEASPIKEFDAISLTTVFYLLDSRERVRMLSLVDQYLKDDGFAIVQDFAYRTSGDKSKLGIFSKWDAGTYRTYVKFKGNPVLYDVFHWNNGRCRSLVAGPDIGKLALGRRLLRAA